MASDRVEYAYRLVELWNSGDYERWLEEAGPELELTPDPSFPDAGTYSGKALRRWILEWTETWGENRLELIGVEEDEGAVLIRGRWHLITNQGSGEVPAGEFTLVLIYPDDEAERPNRMSAHFDHEQARAAARAGTG